MFCPECGEIIGSGPLDLRCGGRNEGSAAARPIGRWLRATFGDWISLRSRRDASRRRRCAVED